MIPPTTTHPAKSNQVFCLPQRPNIPHYLAEEYIQVTNNILPWMRDLHSADLPIATTEPITSHNKCLQVVKSSAIAKHLTEWSDILWKDSHTPGNTTKLRLYRLFKTTYAIKPYLVIMANSQLRKSLHKFRIGCYQQKLKQGDTNPQCHHQLKDSANSAQLTVWRTRSIS